MTSPSETSARISGRLLVVQGIGALGERITNPLSAAGFAVEVLSGQSHAFHLARHRRFDVILLDMTLPGVNGGLLCRAMRLLGANRLTPVVMITAESYESDRVLGLESGADDYLTAPFGNTLLLARMAVLLRR
jgi:DNA-binding response OmpR family regulator